MAVRKYSNIIDLKKDVEAYCVKALADTLEELRDELNRIIKKDVYGVQRGLFYERTHILLIPAMIKLRIWNAFSSNRVGGTLTFDEDWFDNAINLDNYQHGNPYFGELTMESYLQILNNQYKPNHPKMKNGNNSPYLYLGFHSVIRKPFWDDFMDWIDSQGGFNAIYKKHLGEYVKIVKVVNGEPIYKPK